MDYIYYYIIIIRLPYTQLNTVNLSSTKIKYFVFKVTLNDLKRDLKLNCKLSSKIIKKSYYTHKFLETLCFFKIQPEPFLFIPKIFRQNKYSFDNFLHFVWNMFGWKTENLHKIIAIKVWTFRWVTAI